MNADRELLELAAKAAGPLQGRHRAPIGEPAILCANDLYWCPLQDDGDALRLAVTLRLHVDIGKTSVDVWWWDENRDCHDVGEDLGDDPAAAVRRCIVRAAAEMAKVEA